MGGAERTLLSMLNALDGFDVEVFLLQADSYLVKEHLSGFKVHLSAVHKSPKFLSQKNRLWLPFYPLLIESFDFSSFDIVISSSNSFAHGVITNSKTTHITYYHSPCRYLWDWKNEYEKENNFGLLKKIIARFLLHKQRKWDFLASMRADLVLANSKTVQARNQKYYRRESELLYPPVNTGDGSVNMQKQNYYLLASTHTPYKKIDIAIEAFNKLGTRLKIAGTGKDTERLKKMANSNIEFLGFVTDNQLWKLMENARAFIFPGVEDFGITPVEAMGRGCPVIAKNKGGLSETVINGQTGLLYNGESDDLQNAIIEFESQTIIDPNDCVKQATNFNEENFKKRFRKLIEKHAETI